MRVRALEMGLFGLFSDRTIDFGEREDGQPDFHLIHGPNESGKTTLMEGYLRLLYGFPLRDPYGFKHQRANLRVRGVLEIDGEAHDLTRGSARSGNLRNVQGLPASEGLLQAALRGIGIDDYRKLLCLNDASIEEGGEEIVNSEGEIGRLLFSAAAGISDLSPVLDDVKARAEDFYRKGGSRQRYAQLARELKALLESIREEDVSASEYRALRDALANAGQKEREARDERQRLTRWRVRLEAIVAAHPVVRRLRSCEEALAPLDHYPRALDIDPEELVKMLQERVELVFARDRAVRVREERSRERDTLTLRPDLMELVQEFEALSGMRGRVEGAEADLPRRRQQQEDDRREMRRTLSGHGIEDGGDPARFVLREAQLAKLERRLARLREAEQALKAARSEERTAARRMEEASQASKAAEDRLEGLPDLQPVLDRHNASVVVEGHGRAVHAVSAARAAVRERLADLSVKGVVFGEVPSLPVTVSEADDLAQELLKASEAAGLAVEGRRDATQAVEKVKARLEAISAASDLVTDAVAAESRAQRDQSWQEHRAALSEPTADAFEAAMKADDANTALRQQQARDVAELRQLQAAVADTGATQAAARERLACINEERSRLQERLAGLLSGTGLPGDLSARDFAGWVRLAEAALRAQSALQNEIERGREVAALADALRAELAGILGEPAASLEALFNAARDRAASRAELRAKADSARETLDREAAALESRRNRLCDCEAELEAAELQWQDACDVLPEAARQADLRDALPALRSLREIGQRMEGVQRQIEGMERDEAAFREKLLALAEKLPEMAAIPVTEPLEAFRLVHSAFEAAREADRESRRLEAEIADAEQDLQDAETGLEVLDCKVRALAEAFDSRIPTGSLEELRKAVQEAQTAIGLRESVRAAAEDLLASLATGSREKAEAALAEKTLEAAEAELLGVGSDLNRAEETLEQAIAERSEAMAALRAVSGGGDVAELLARQETIEIEMEDGLRRYLEDRLGHWLANQAIRRYRDTHRSGMMQAAERAFAALTDGAYCKLATQAAGSTEMLVAMDSSDGAAKQVNALSKGTRFQLYLALRAAAYEQMASNGTVLPFLCDDVFETFDEVRTRAACRLMRQIGRTGQAIYLTHHRHVADIAEEICGNDVRIHQI